MNAALEPGATVALHRLQDLVDSLILEVEAVTALEEIQWRNEPTAVVSNENVIGGPGCQSISSSDAGP